MLYGRIPISQCAEYLACSPKSNAAYVGIKKAQSLVRETGNLPVPLHLRNVPTKLMKDIGYGKDYQYAHDHKDSFVDLEYLPEEIKGVKFYEPGDNATEQKITEKMRGLWKDKYGY